MRAEADLEGADSPGVDFGGVGFEGVDEVGVALFCVGFIVNLLDCPCRTEERSRESNTMSIELPYDVVHHATDVFEGNRTTV